MKKLLLASALLAALSATSANAGVPEKIVKMPDFLIGTWCHIDDDDGDAGEMFWNVNSMERATRRTITDCVAVSWWNFTLEGKTEEGDRLCYAMKLGPIKKDTAPSGTAYDLSISAKCYKFGAFDNQNPKIEVFKFSNYKHWITVTK